MKVLRMADLDLAGKRVLIREDFNVPLQLNRDTGG
jgi:3-phosphoglycerate kinase